MRKLIYIFVFVITGLSSFAQNTEKKLEEANEAFEGYGYDQAIRKYEKLDPEQLEVQRNLGLSYWRTNKMNLAEEVFAQIVITEGHTSEDVYRYASILRENKKYDLSEKVMKRFIELEPEDSRGQDFMNNLHHFGEIVEDRGKQKVKRLAINTDDQDFGGTFYQGKLVFSTTRQLSRIILRKWSGNGKAYLKVCSADMDSTGALSNLQEFEGKLSRRYHNGPVAISDDGTMMVITRNAKGDQSKKGNLNLQLVVSRKENDKWQKPELLHFNSETYSCGQASISRDGKWLYFVSNMPGGFGGTDIYRADIREDGTFGDPENLGKLVNTEGDEMFPFYHSDDGILFFSSDGKLGLGGLDVFVAEVKSDFSIGKVFNPGKPINSNRDDFGIVVDSLQERGYLSSNRSGTGTDDDDLYAVKILEPFLFGRIVQGVVKDENGELVEGASVRFLDALTGIEQIQTTDADGRYRFGTEQISTFSIHVTKDGYTEKEHISSSVKRGVLDVRDLVILKRTKILFQFSVFDSQSGMPISDVVVKLTNKSDSTDIYGETSKFGDCLLTLSDKTELNTLGDFDIKVRKEGYLTKIISFKMLLDHEGIYDLNEYLKRELEEAMKMTKVNIGLDLNDVMEINPIYYDYAESNIREDAKVELDKIVKIMNDNENIRIELRAHTDSRGSDESNLRLSKKRVNAAIKYIKKRISNPRRVTGVGVGESELINDCEDGVECTEEQHQENRRTEFIIIEL
jgi:outer membrane protein OmpA-like peptidoglycan-associated protein